MGAAREGSLDDGGVRGVEAVRSTVELAAGRITAVRATALEAADETRSLAGFAITDVRVDENEDLRVVWDGRTVREAGSDDEANGTIERGPAPLGSMTRFALDEDAIPVGALAAPIVAQALAFADARWGLGLGELVPATDVSR